MGNAEFKGANPQLSLKDGLANMTDDQYDNYKQSQSFQEWCVAQGIEDVPEDQAAAEEMIENLTEE